MKTLEEFKKNRLKNLVVITGGSNGKKIDKSKLKKPGNGGKDD